MKRAHVFIEGHVQGVGFRHFTKTNAREHNVKGWVKNLPDGRVEAVFEGEESQINTMLDLVKKGPGTSRVSDVDVEWEAPEQEFDSFRVTYA